MVASPPPYDAGPAMALRAPRPSPLRSQPLFAPAESDGGDDDSHGFGFPDPALLSSPAQPLVQRMPPSVYHRLAWRNDNPRTALSSLETSALHGPNTEMDTDEMDADTPDDAVFADARSVMVSMALPADGISAHMVADTIQLSSDRRTARAQGGAARGVTIDTATGSLALAYIREGEAHLELAIADGHGSDMDQDPPPPATQLRRSGRFSSKPADSSAPSSSVPRTSLRIRPGGSRVVATPRWRVMLGDASPDDIAMVTAEALATTQLRNSATHIIDGIQTWGHGAVSLVVSYIKLSQLRLSAGNLPLARACPQPITAWLARGNTRRVTPAVLDMCDKSFGKTLHKWIKEQVPVIPTHDDSDPPPSAETKWEGFAVDGPRGLCLIVIGLLIWRSHIDVLNKTSVKDLQSWATVLAEVTDIFRRVLNDFDPPAHSDDGEGEVAGPSTVKRRRVTASAVRQPKRRTKKA
jgi:hypothetical protein